MQAVITVCFLIVPFVVLVDTMFIFMMRTKMKKIETVVARINKKVLSGNLAALASKYGATIGEEDLEDFAEMF